MAYQEEHTERQRMVVETPNSRREVHTEAVRYPDSRGLTSASLAAIVVGVVVLVAISLLFFMYRQQDTTNANLASQQPPQTTIVQQPAQQPPVIVQQPATTTQPAPVIVNNPPAAAPVSGSTSKYPDDSTIQAAVDKRFSDDPVFSTLGIVANVANGKVTLTGTVKSEALKAQIERAVRNIKGVKSIDNQITIG
jgi:cytoskeletal protein RodZ